MKRWMAAGALLLPALIAACEQRPIDPDLRTTHLNWQVAYEYEQQPVLYTVWMESSNNIIAAAPSLAYRRYYHNDNSQPAIYHYDGAGWSRMDFIFSKKSFGFSLWGPGPDNIFAAEGLLHHFDGSSWAATGQPAYMVWGNEEGDVFAASEDIVYRYDGRNWLPVYQKEDESNPPRAFWVGPGPVWAAAWIKDVVLWDGNRWRTQELPTVNGLWGTSINNLYAVGYKANSIVSEESIWHFDGANWAPVPLENSVNRLYGIWGTGDDDIYAVGEFGTVLHYNGLNWEEMRKSTAQDLYGIHGGGPDDICIVGSANTALRYNGSSWERISQSAPAEARRVWAESPSRMIAWRTDRGCFRFENGEWREEYAPFMSLTGISEALAGTSMNDLYASDYGSIYHYDGVGWILSADSLPRIRSFYVAASNDIFAVGDGTIRRFDGGRWNIMIEEFPVLFFAVWGSSADNVFAAGDNGVILHFDGSDWKPQESGAGRGFYGLWGAAADDVYAAGAAGVFHYNGKRWAPVPGFENRHFMWITGSSADNVVAANYEELFQFDGFAWRRNESINGMIQHVTTALDGSIICLTDDAILYITE